MELRLDGRQLLVPPFRIARRTTRYVQSLELTIALGDLEPDVYRILAVQNFWVDDHDPDLSICPAAVFLARRRRDGDWEAPETWPVECRTLATLGHVDVRDPHQIVLSGP